MDTLVCQNEGHNNDIMIAVCMDKQCKSKQRICCLQCIIESHGTHKRKLIQVDRLSAFIQQESQKQNISPESLSQGKKQIIQGFENLLTLIDCLKKIIMKELETFKQQNLQEYLKKNFCNQQGFQYWNKLLEGMLDFVEVDNCIINTSASKEAQLNEIDKRHINIIKQSEESLQTMINQISKTKANNDIVNETQMQISTQIKIDKGLQTLIDNPIKIGKLHFDRNRTNKDIVIIDQHTIKKTQTNSWAMAYTDCGFDPSTQSFKFAVNIQNNSSQIFVGVGNDQGNIVPSYIIPSFSKMNHGQYMISNDTCTFHNTTVLLNFKSGISFSFTTGDKIHIKYDHLAKILEFRKESDSVKIQIYKKNKIIKMRITDMTKHLYPSVMLYSPGCQAQLVEC